MARPGRGRGGGVGGLLRTRARAAAASADPLAAGTAAVARVLTPAIVIRCLLLFNLLFLGLLFLLFDVVRLLVLEFLVWHRAMLQKVGYLVSRTATRGPRRLRC